LGNKNNKTSNDSSNHRKRKLSNNLTNNSECDDDGENEATFSLDSAENVTIKRSKLVNENRDEFQKTVRKYDLYTKFVLGKNVNELFTLMQQQQQQSQSQDTTDNNNNKKRSIYTKFPHLFKYSPDNEDKEWLNNRHIIKRKNIKCFLLCYDQVIQLLDASLSNGQTINNDHYLNKKKELKTFKLPDFILYKLNKQNFYFH
jgi:hypothetical protein